MSIGPNHAEIGDRLKQLRNREQLSQTEFATSLGISLRAYQSYERGQKILPTEVISELLLRYGTDPAWVLTGKGPQQWGGTETIDTNLFTNVFLALMADDNPIIGKSPYGYAYYAAVVYNRIKVIGNSSNWDREIKIAIVILRKILSAQYSPIVERIGENFNPPDELRWPEIVDLVREHGKEVDPRTAKMTWIPGGDLERKFISGEI